VGHFSAFIRNLSVSWKFILAYYAVLIIPLAFFGFYFYTKSSEDSISQAELVMESNLLQTRASILQKVKLIENASLTITTDSNVRSIFYYEYINENERLKDFQFDIVPMLENACRQNSLIYAIRVYSSQAVFTEMVGSYYSVRKKDSPDHYDKLIQSVPIGSGWISAHTSVGNALRLGTEKPDEVFSFSGSILSPVSVLESKIGQVEIEVKENHLFDMLRDSATATLGTTFVVNKDGVVVSNGIPDLYKKNVTAFGFLDYQAGAELKKIEDIEGKKSILISIPVEDIGCSIVGIYPVENFTGEAKASLINLLTVLVVLSVVLGVIIYLITNILLRRVKRLVKAMKQVRDNNLDVSVPVSAMDEFGELALNFNHMTGRIHELVETVYKIQLMERDAELKALEAQINPHFLYNTLATISWVARKGTPDEIIRISNSLAKFYRLVLNKGVTTIKVKDEIDMVKAYLQIQKIRFGDMFDVLYRIDEDAMDRTIIKNLLQPLVENALTHGIEPKRSHGFLILRVELVQGNLVLQVIDDGVGMDSRTLVDVKAGRVERSSGGYAVKNVIERLEAYYEEKHSFEVFSAPGIGSQFIITIEAGGLEHV
jgi:two-component system sensor histidine kinase YesM